MELKEVRNKSNPESLIQFHSFNRIESKQFIVPVPGVKENERYILFIAISGGLKRVISGNPTVIITVFRFRCVNESGLNEGKVPYIALL